MITDHQCLGSLRTLTLLFPGSAAVFKPMHARAWAMLWICYWPEHAVVLVCSRKKLRDTARLIPNWGGDSTYSICTDKSTKAPLLCPYPVLKQQRLHHRGDGNRCMSFPWSPNGDQVTLSEAFTYWNTLLKCLWFVQTCWLYFFRLSEWCLGGVFIFVVVPVLITKLIALR